VLLLLPSRGQFVARSLPLPRRPRSRCAPWELAGATARWPAPEHAVTALARAPRHSARPRPLVPVATSAMFARRVCSPKPCALGRSAALPLASSRAGFQVPRGVVCCFVLLAGRKMPRTHRY
jgi:hypothetical protein